MASDTELLEHLQERLVAEGHQVWHSLEQRGFGVLDDALGEALATELLEHMCVLDEASLFRPNQVRFTVVDREAPGGHRAVVVSKPDIYELDLHQSQEVRDMVPSFRALFDGNRLVELLQSTQQRYYENRRQQALLIRGDATAVETVTPDASDLEHVRLAHGANGKTIKLQLNKGGCFPLHHDNPGAPNRRVLTCLVYLNRDWKVGDGGELVAQPFLGAQAYHVAPRFDRMVLFRADVLLHRVLPAHRTRYCFTVWIDASGDDTYVNSSKHLSLLARHIRLSSYDDDLARAAAFFQRSPLQRCLTRFVYAEEYEASLRECMGHSSDGKILLHSHAAAVAHAKANRELDAFVEHCRAYKQLHCDPHPPVLLPWYDWLTYNPLTPRSRSLTEDTGV